MTRGTRSRRLFNIYLCTVATNGVFVRGPRFSRWHTNEEDFRGHHLLLSGHARQIFAMTDDVAEGMRKIGRTLHKRQQCLKNSNEESVARDDDEAPCEPRVPDRLLGKTRGNRVDAVGTIHRTYRPAADRTWRAQCAPARSTAAWLEFYQGVY